uniref:Uncharacterized protein n=1 Tax=Babesia bovis TaxID=5865 RepID=S6BM02_BABBO|nr:hypothetical protein [Babesia bovis]
MDISGVISRFIVNAAVLPLFSILVYSNSSLYLLWRYRIPFMTESNTGFHLLPCFNGSESSIIIWVKWTLI